MFQSGIDSCCDTLDGQLMLASVDNSLFPGSQPSLLVPSNDPEGPAGTICRAVIIGTQNGVAGRTQIAALPLGETARQCWAPMHRRDAAVLASSRPAGDRVGAAERNMVSRADRRIASAGTR